ATARKKKESTDPRLSQLGPPYVTPSSSSSLEYHRSDARIVENGFAAGSGMSNSAKVGLVRVIIGIAPSCCTTDPISSAVTHQSFRPRFLPNCYHFQTPLPSPVQPGHRRRQ